MEPDGSLFLAARALLADSRVTFSIVSGNGRLTPFSSNGVYYSPSSQAPTATARLLVTAVANSAAARFVDITFDSSSQPLNVIPNFTSGLPLATRQTFAVSEWAVRPVPGTSSAYYTNVGVPGVEWFAWPFGSISDGGTLTATIGTDYVFAREPTTNRWAATAVSIGPGPAIEMVPAVSTVGRNGVVQLTATTSDGSPVIWSVITFEGGSVNQSGTFTAPAQPGISLVEASSGWGTAYATIVVQ